MSESIEPHEVIVKGRGLVLGYACPKCRVFHSAAIYTCKWEDAVVASRESAMGCCDRKCEDCGNGVDEKHYAVCAECRLKRDATREFAAFNAAQKIPESEYVGWLSFGNDVFCNEDELADHCTQNEIDWPAWVWACSKVEFRIDADDIIENALQEHYDGASSQVRREDETELQTLLDTWCAKVGKRWSSWEEDRTRVVVLEPRNLSDD
jgi:hypothetical protein